MDRITIPNEGISFSPSIYLPPCYAENSQTDYPVLYWTAIGGQYMFDEADHLILKGDLPPFILVMLEIDGAKGYGADTQIIEYVVPYIDSHFRTQPDRRHRSITGISHGAAIAVRAAFQAPDVFGRVAVISGGIDGSEQDKFANWISTTPRDQWPDVLIDIGDQDAIFRLTRALMDVLDEQGVPYTFTQGKGSHSQMYWSSQMAYYLKWLVPGGAGIRDEVRTDRKMRHPPDRVPRPSQLWNNDSPPGNYIGHI